MQQPLLKSPSRTPVVTKKKNVSTLIFFRPVMAKNIHVKKFLGLNYEMKRVALKIFKDIRFWGIIYLFEA